MIRYLYSTLFALLSGFVLAQEGLKPLSGNLSYMYEDLKLQPRKADPGLSHQKTAAVSLQLPFVEDFYYAPTSSYPDQMKWSDSSVYVNAGFPTAPPSIGVATFDGLNKHGYPYNPTLANLTLSNRADTLTSQPINLYTQGSQTLNPAFDLAISFYYQARGKGDSPELTDSLILDFFRPYAKPDTAWKRVWFATGNTNSNTNDSVFKRGFVRITDTAYFHDGFRFRFRNWASVTGDFDHWHLDYIFLDKGRGDSLFDTVRNDLTIVDIPYPFLKDYSHMPYQHYTTSEMAANTHVKIRNNGAKSVSMLYYYRIYDEQNNLLFPEYSGGYDNLKPFRTNGYSKYALHAHPQILNSFQLPNPPVRQTYQIKHFAPLNSSDPTNPTDIIKDNDTVRQYMSFADYYAFDDGSAEAGYYVNAIGAKMAVKIRTNVADNLYALRIYFDLVGNSQLISSTTSAYTFTINVWSINQNGAPGDLIYRDSSGYHPTYYKSGYKLIPEYKLRRPLYLPPGTYFIGIQQSTEIITVGFDRNYNHMSSLYYDSGNGWTQSSEPGSIMIRPVFTDVLKEVVGIKEAVESSRNPFLVYPNPSKGQFTILSPDLENMNYNLYNTLGQMVKQGALNAGENSVPTPDLGPGIYMLILKNKGQILQQEKIILQH